MLKARGQSQEILKGLATLIQDIGNLEKDTEGCSSVYTKVIDYKGYRYRFFFDDRQIVGTLKVKRI